MQAEATGNGFETSGVVVSPHPRLVARGDVLAVRAEPEGGVEVLGHGS